MPEFVDVDNDGRNEILISAGAYLLDRESGKILSYPEKTKIYKWNGKIYELLKIVPWFQRLK